jgi:hypothetical protein
LLAADPPKVKDDRVAPGWRDDDGRDAFLAELAPGGPGGPLDAGDADGLVAAIEAAQHELISTPAERLLVVQGGPGTARTLVTLGRVAWLVHRNGSELSAADVLMVGPSTAFVRYAGAVLAALDTDGVVLLDIAGLGLPVERGRREAPHVTRLKGDARMAGLLSRALTGRVGRLPADLPATITVDGRSLDIDRAVLHRAAATAHASEAPPGDRRRILSAVLAAGGADYRVIREAADTLAELIWPDFTPASFLRELLGSREWLAHAAADEFSRREIYALHRPLAGRAVDDGFGDADLPLLDEAAELLGTHPRRYAYVMVDEAQDLSPMQLRAVARRSANGAMTVAGDMAQSTGPWARDDWDDVLAHLPATMPRVDRELAYGYRVPRRIFDLAAELLPAAAPAVAAPAMVREGPADPVIAPVDDESRAGVVVAAAAGHAARGRTVAIICPSRCRAGIEGALRAQGVPWQAAAGDGPEPCVRLLSPHEAKGLEFDAVVVVEPGDIVDDDPRGHRLLYIALTRATRYLHLVGAAADLPAEFTDPTGEEEDGGDEGRQAGEEVALAEAAIKDPGKEPPPRQGRGADEPSGDDLEPGSLEEPGGAEDPELEPAVREAIDTLAHTFAEALLANLTPELWPLVLGRVARLIDPDDPRT